MPKDKPLLNITPRHAKVTNLNDSPEKAGDDLVPKMDVSLEFMLKPNELAQFIRTRPGSRSANELFWDKRGNPVLLDVDHVEPDFIGQGKVELTSTKDSGSFVTADPATLKKLKIQPIAGHEAIVRAQVRLDPTGYREELGGMRLEQACQFSFTGSGEEPERAGKKKQRDAFNDGEPAEPNAAAAGEDPPQ